MTDEAKPSNYCYTCQKVVDRCWNGDGMCGGGGHCQDCMGYDFEPPCKVCQKPPYICDCTEVVS